MDYAKEYRRFCRIGDSLPKYMRKNLKSMPNDKGYIWKGCWFFGMGKEKVKSQKNFTLFENHSGVMKIHEYKKQEYKLYEKVGKEKKKLVDKEKRKRRKMLFLN